MHSLALFTQSVITLLILPMALAAPAAAPPAKPAANSLDLDVSRVALFSSGVGYFECDQTIDGTATAELSFRTDQINDIIKSMVVQDYGGGRIGVISYASQDPLAKALASFGVNLTGNPTLGDILTQLRGEPVAMSGPREIKGTIVGVEKQQITLPDGKTTQMIERLTLLTDQGLEQIELTQLQNLKLTNEKMDGELRKALATLATAHDAEKKSVLVNFEGQGARQVRVAYLLEAPIWKTSYRLVVGEENKAFLQGWATVENATERDWNNVSLSLISGRPISFRMDLYTPLYVPRPLEQLEIYASLRPPSYEGGIVEQMGRGKPQELKQAPPTAVRHRLAYGDATTQPGDWEERTVAFPDTVDSSAFYFSGGTEPARPAGVQLEGTGVASVAKAQEAGELFEYRIDTPVSIPRQHSAMLPIANQQVDVAKVSIFNPATHKKYPLNGLELTNTTGLNLMQGPVTVFDDNVYAGDAKLPDLKPDEKRLVAYALDLSTEVMVKQPPQPDELISVRIAKGTFYHRHKVLDQRAYVIKNKIDRPRTVLLEQAYTDDWKLIEPQEPYERTQTLARFRVEVPAKETVTQSVKLERVADQSFLLTNVGLDQIQFYLKSNVSSPQVKEALEKVVALRTEIDEINRQRAGFEKQRDESIQEQARIRENLKTLDKGTDAYQRQLKSFDEVDARIVALRDQIAAARQLEEQKSKALVAYVVSLEIE